MHDVITALDMVTPAWLTRVLRRSGALPQGEVITVAHRANAAFNSATVHLEVIYSADAPREAPRALLLKRNRTEEWAVAAGEREVGFYHLAATLPHPLPILAPCYDAVYDLETHNSHLLLLDLSDSHEPPINRDEQIAGEKLPSDAQLNGAIDALARFHAAWWEHPSLGSGVAAVSGWCRDTAHFQAYVQRRNAQWASFSAATGAMLTAEVRAVCEESLAGTPFLWERFLARRITRLDRLTLIHGDSYLANFLSPLSGREGATYMIDFQSVGADLGAGDLVNMLATFWTPAQRHNNQREERALRRYLATLHAAGVRRYTWDDLLLDYRLMLIDWLCVPIWDQTNGSSQGYWWPKLHCLVAAYRDHRCEELLRP